MCARVLFKISSSLGPFHGFFWLSLRFPSFLDECLSINCPGIKKMPLDLLSVVIGTFNSCPLGGAELRGSHLRTPPLSWIPRGGQRTGTQIFSESAQGWISKAGYLE